MRTTTGRPTGYARNTRSQQHVMLSNKLQQQHITNQNHPPPSRMNKNPITIEQLNDMVETKRALCQVVRGNQGRSYYLGDFLGKGGFAKVYKCFQLDHNNCANGDKKVLAAKVVQKELLRKQNSREKMAMEINIHKSIRHENIVDFHSNFEDKKTGAVYVLLELCDARSLMELSKRRHKLSEPEVRFYMKQMLAGLRHLHDINIIHRDLKLSNVLLAKDSQIGLVCKLADFGLATKVSDGKDDNLKRKTMCGTPNYISPEILNKVGHGKPTDIWSTACMMYALLHGKPPFETDKLETTYNKIKRNEYNIPSSERRSAATSMIKNMLHPDPEKRLSCRMLCEHPFIVRGYCPPYMPESAMTVAPAFNEKQNESILYEPEAKNNYIPPATRKPPLASSTQAMSQPSENMAISPEPPARRDDADDYLNVTQHQSHEHLFKCMAKHTENILEQTRELQNWVYSRGDANAYNPQMVNDNVDMDEAEDPAKRPVYWISKWVDYSDKYGLGYTLADNSVGVLYNDSARLIMQKNGIHLQFIPQTIYNERLLLVNEIKPDNRDLYKKLKLLRHFNNYMKEHLVQCGDTMEKDNNICRLPYLIKWYRTAKAIVLMLSTGTVQINFFSCHTKLFFDPSVEALTYIDHHKKMITYDIKELKKTGMRTDVFQKVLYCRKLISTLHAALKPDSGHTGKLLNIH